MSLDNVLLTIGFMTEAAAIGLLVFRHAWKKLPIFFVYLIWDLLSNVGNLIVLRSSSGSSYLTTYLLATIVDSLLVFSVLVEVSWSVLKPIRALLSRFALIAVGFAILAVGVAVWPISGVHWQAQIPWKGNLLAQLQQTVSIVRVLFFIALAGCSQLLSIGWRDRELQVATGLGFYSLVSLAAAMLRTHQTSLAQYSHLNQLVVASYVISLMYWVFSFAQKESVRREFTPKMEQFLLSLAGNARAARLAMAGTSVDDKHADGKP